MALCLLTCVLGACTTQQIGPGGSRSESASLKYGIDPEDLIDLPDGSRIVFFGDSITAGGVLEGGYVTLVEKALEDIFPDRDLEIIGTGVSGDTTSDLKDRLSNDVISQNPTHVVIYVGVNDVASLGPDRRAGEVGLKAYRDGIHDLVTRIHDSGSWVAICTPGPIGEDMAPDEPIHDVLNAYAEVAREVAADLQTGLCDVSVAVSEHLKIHNVTGRDRGILTRDGIHFNRTGHRLIAQTMLRTLVTNTTPPPRSEQ